MTPPVVYSVAIPLIAAPREAAVLLSAVVRAVDALVDVLDEDEDSNDIGRNHMVTQRPRVRLEI